MKTLLFISYLIALLLSAFELKQTNQSNDTECQIIWKSGDNNDSDSTKGNEEDDNHYTSKHGKSKNE